MVNPLSPAQATTCALVLCGGQSSRMGTDKSMLVYYDKPQRYHVYEMLQDFCDHVYISCRHSQVQSIEPGYHCLADDHRYHDTGPMAALLTAFEKFPSKDVLLVGCDYPFLTWEELQHFFGFLPAAGPVAFYNEDTGISEPLLAWYPHAYFEALRNYQLPGHYSLKQFLQETGAMQYLPEDKKCMWSVDTMEDFDKAKLAMRSRS